jgi:general secretion pathway protein C
MKRYFFIANLVLWGILIYTGVSSFYRYVSVKLSIPETKAAQTERETEQKQIKMQPLSHYRPIVARNLFETKLETLDKVKAQKPKPPPVTELKKTELRLKLWGTVTGNDTEARAVIEDQLKREQNLYTVDDTIQEAKIKSIERERVILTVNGQDEVLEMEKLVASAASAGARRPTPAKRKPNPAATKAAARRNIRLKRAEIDEAMSDLSSVMRQAKIRPYYSGGRPQGISITRIRRNSIFSKLGLRSGDVIMGVNGQRIQSVDDAMKFYQNLTDGDALALQIKRRGRPQTLSYQIE